MKLYNRIGLNKDDTMTIKGIAIILMVCNHLFPIPEWIFPENMFFSITIGSKNFAALIGAFGKICVALFAFLSGYGLSFTYQRSIGVGYKHSISKLPYFLMEYWFVILVIYIPIMSVVGLFNFDLKEFILNLFGYQTTYCKIAWYVRFYLEIVLTFPIWTILMQKNVVRRGVIIIIGSAAAITILTIFAPNSYLVALMVEYFSYLPVVICGYLTARTDAFTQFSNKLYRIDLLVVYLITCLIVMVARSSFKTFTGFNMDVIYAPVLIYSLLGILRKIQFTWLRKGLDFLGRYSLEMWFLHAIFFIGSPVVQRVGYWPKIDILILLWVFIILLPVAIEINKIVVVIISVTSWVSKHTKTRFAISLEDCRKQR